jgi:hypothetical protein
MFVTAKDFDVRPYKLPLLDTEDNAAEFAAFVENWESEWLPKIFGYSFYGSFMLGVSELPPEWDEEENYLAVDETLVVSGVSIYKAIADNTNSEPSAINSDWELVEEANKWLQIIKGGSYYFVPGRLFKWEGLIKAEKFAIFSEWLKASVNHVSGVSGNVTPDTENAETYPSAQDISTSWNKFARMIGGRTEYDKWNTLFGFLLATNAASGSFDESFDPSFGTFVTYMKCEFGYPQRKNQFNF